MDCPSKENLIQIKLDGIPGIEDLDLDIPFIRLTVFTMGRLTKYYKFLFQTCLI